MTCLHWDHGHCHAANLPCVTSGQLPCRLTYHAANLMRKELEQGEDIIIMTAQQALDFALERVTKGQA